MAARPERGRNEIEPAADRALPDPAESFSRSWSTSSDVTPVNDAPRATARPSAIERTAATDSDMRARDHHRSADVSAELQPAAHHRRATRRSTPPSLTRHPRGHRGLRGKPGCGEMLNGELHVPPQSCCSAGRIRGPDRNACRRRSRVLRRLLPPAGCGRAAGRRAAARSASLPVSRAPSEASQAASRNRHAGLCRGLHRRASLRSFAAEPPYRRSERMSCAISSRPPCGSPSRVAAHEVRDDGAAPAIAPPRTRVVQGQIDPGALVGYPLADRAGAVGRAAGDLRRLRRASGLSGRAERQDHPRRQRRRLNRPWSGWSRYRARPPRRSTR